MLAVLDWTGLDWTTYRWRCADLKYPYLEFIYELFAHGLEDRLEEGPTEDEGRVEVGQGVAEGGHVAEAQPTGVVHLYAIIQSLLLIKIGMRNKIEYTY